MVDRLRGLKENVIMGRIIPAGTGIVQHTENIIESLADDEPEKPYELAETVAEVDDESVKLEDKVVLTTGRSESEIIE
jgi:DNA-directed RNA polymerase subunit beta'